MTKIIGVIPCHMASIRFPGKILFPFYDLAMVEHVRRRAGLCVALDDIYIATCDDDIAAEVKSHGGTVIRTSNTHRNGTSRVAEAIEGLDCSHVVLLQGDEPLLLPRHLDQLAAEIIAAPEVHAWNVTGPITEPQELDRHSFVKCTVRPDGKILYCFRRSPSVADFDVQQSYIRKILGIVAYRRDFLTQLTSLPDSIVDGLEMIEQMKIVENGFDLFSVPVAESLPSVNEPQEAGIVLEYAKGDAEQQKLLELTLGRS